MAAGFSALPIINPVEHKWLKSSLKVANSLCDLLNLYISSARTKFWTKKKTCIVSRSYNNLSQRITFFKMIDSFAIFLLFFIHFSNFLQIVWLYNYQLLLFLFKAKFLNIYFRQNSQSKLIMLNWDL